MVTPEQKSIIAMLKSMLIRLLKEKSIMVLAGAFCSGVLDFVITEQLASGS